MPDLGDFVCQHNVNPRPVNWTKLRSYCPAHARLATDLAHQNSSCTFTTGQDKYIATLTEQPEGKRRLLFLVIWFEFFPIGVYTDERLISELLTHQGFHQPLKQLSISALALVCDHIIYPQLKGLISLPDQDFYINEAGFEETSVPEVGIHFSIQGPTFSNAPLTLTGDNETLQKVANCIMANWRKAEEKTRNNRLKVPVSFQADGITTTCQEFDDLRIGDGFLLPFGWTRDQVDKLVIGNTYLSAQRVGQDEIRIDSELTEITSETQGLVRNMKKDSNMTIELAIEISRSKYDFEDLQALKEGAVIKFPTKVGSSAALVHNTEKVADCEVVEIGGDYGIRITALR